MSESALAVSEVGDVTVVSFQGNSILDVSTVQQIGRELYELVEAQGKLRIMLDFKEVRFLSSQALGVLLTLRRKADKAGAEVVVSQARPELARVFKITKIDDMFKFFDDNAQAMAYFGEQSPAADAE